MRLNDPLITEIEFGGVSYPIDLSFDNVLDVFEVLEDMEIPEDLKLDTTLELLFGNCGVLKLPFEKRLELYSTVLTDHLLLGRETVQRDIKGNPMPIPKQQRYMDLVQDAAYIYASFRFSGIDLFEEQGRLQWEQFQALLEGLPEESIIQRIIQIRSWKPSKGDSIEHREQMKKLQQQYALEILTEGGEDDE